MSQHCESGGNPGGHGPRQFRFVWDFRNHKYRTRSWERVSYRDWQEHCILLKEYFNEYLDVSWTCNSFEFIATCNNLCWVADEILRGNQTRFLADVTSMQRWIPDRGHQAMTFEELLTLT